MDRSGWKKSLVVALSWGGLAWGQSPQLPAIVQPSVPEQIKPVPAGSVADPIKPIAANSNERIITVQEPGKPPQQCRVLREWKMNDGNWAKEVQALDTGEIMTIVDAGSIMEKPEAYPTIRQQGRSSSVIRWGRDRTPPSGTPMPPLAPASAVAAAPGTPLPPVAVTFPSSTDTSSRVVTTAPAKTGSKPVYMDKTNGASTAANTGAAPAMPGASKLVVAPVAEQGTPTSTASTPAVLPGVSKLVVQPATESKTTTSSTSSSAAHMVSTSDPSSTKPTESRSSTAAIKTSETTAKPSSDKHEEHAKAEEPKPLWKRWFGNSEDTDQFNREKYLAELRAKYGNGSPQSVNKPKETMTAAAPKITEPKDPTKTKPADTTTAAKPAVEKAEASDWRKSWGKSDTAKKEEIKSPKEVASVFAKEKEPAKTPSVPDVPVAKVEIKPEVKAPLPAPVPAPAPAPTVAATDPLQTPERYSRRTELRPDAPKPAENAPSPLLTAQVVDPKPSAKPVETPKPTTVVTTSAVQEEQPGKASTVKIPLGAQSVAMAYGQTNQIQYLPVPMMTVPGTVHSPKPPQPPQANSPRPPMQVPPEVAAAYRNAFTPDAGMMPAGYEAQSDNAFPPGPVMMDPSPMGYGMPPQAMMMGRPMGMPMGMGMPNPAMMGGMMPGMPMGPGVAQAAYYPPPMPQAAYGQPMCDPQMIHQLMQTLREGLYPSQREMAAEALAALDCRAFPQVFEVVLGAAKDDPAPTVRATCIRCLGNLNLPPTVLMMTLQTLKADADPRVRLEAEQALARLPQPKGGANASGIQPAGGVAPAAPK